MVTYQEAEDSKHRHRQKVGRRLISFAWAVEVLAASVGLLIAALTAFQIHQEIIAEEGVLPPSAITNIALGALPFVMVAVVELTKIPLATAFYSSMVLR